MKGCRGYDIEALYEAVVKNSETEGPLSSVGRLGVDYYNQLGYVPYDVKIRENAARTLAYAYADFAIRRLAQALGRHAYGAGAVLADDLAGLGHGQLRI